MGEGTSNRRGFFSDLVREAMGVVREVRTTLDTEFDHDVDQDEPWYVKAPVQARPTRRTLTTAKLLDLCGETGLAARSATVGALARTSARLTRADTTAAASARSRLGGAPDLPPGFEWPRWNDRELAFLGQLDLAETAALDPQLPLPRHGLLLFFHDVTALPSGLDPSHKGSCRVLHIDRNPARLERASADRAWFAEYPLQLSLELTLPRSWSLAAEQLDLEPAERSAWDELRRQLAHKQGIELEEDTPSWQSLHRLLGYPEELGTNTEIDCQLAASGINTEADEAYLDPRREQLEADATDWHLLLQLSPDDNLGTTWGDDFGRLTLWIRKHDLHTHTYDNTWAILR